MRQAWTTDRLTYHGRYWDFDDIEVLPKPLQQPHPPMWVAASSPDAVEWCANEGYTILMDPIPAMWRSAASDGSTRTRWAGRPFHEGREIPVARLLAVAPTDAEAEDIARLGASWTVGAYANPAKRSIVSANATEAGPPAPRKTRSPAT